MGSQLSPFVPILVVLVMALLSLANIKRDTRAILQKQFPASTAPEAPLLQCQVRFPLEDMSTPCVARANGVGLYMVSPAEQAAKWSWLNNVPYLKEPVLVPWSRLDYRRASFPMWNWVRFDVQGTKAVFFIKKAPALELLRQAKKPLPDMHG